MESEAYRLIFLKSEGIPKVICFGNNKKYNILVLELLGKSLDYLFSISSKKFSVKTTLNIAVQMIERIKTIHNNYHIHRDIKPDNFVMGLENDEKKLFLIDFGLSKKYKSQSKGTHIPFKTNKNITGTARYCSINTHDGFEQSRRDDLESIGYVLMYFLRGILPWQGLKVASGEDQYEAIAQKKKSTPLEELCQGFPGKYFYFLFFFAYFFIFWGKFILLKIRNIKIEEKNFFYLIFFNIDAFFEYLKYCRNLEFEEDPNYDYLINLFKKALSNCNLDEPDFDWNKDLKIENQTSAYNIQIQNSRIQNKSLFLNTSNIKANENNVSQGILKSNSFQNEIYIKPEE